MNSVQIFLQKIDRLLLVAGSETNEELKTNLLADLYLDLTTKIGLDPQNRPFLDQIALNPPKTVEEFDKSITLAGEKLKETGFNIEKSIAESSKSVLEGFVSKIEPDLPSEKVAELRKIITEY